MEKNSSLLNSFIFESENFIVLNKPCKYSVHSGTKIKFNVIDFLRINFKFRYNFLELVHRLDKDTSGCLLIAKNKTFLKKFHFLLQSGLVEKEYHAVIKGKLDSSFNSKLNGYQLNNYNVKIKKKVEKSVNYYSLINEYDDYSIIKIFPITGKMHQIRIHLSYIGHPIAGDVKYGSKKFNFILFKTMELNRMFLHLSSIKFKCPIENKFYYVKSTYDDKLVNFLNKLQGNFNAR